MRIGRWRTFLLSTLFPLSSSCLLCFFLHFLPLPLSLTHSLLHRYVAARTRASERKRVFFFLFNAWHVYTGNDVTWIDDRLQPDERRRITTEIFFSFFFSFGVIFCLISDSILRRRTTRIFIARFRMREWVSHRTKWIISSIDIYPNQVRGRKICNHLGCFLVTFSLLFRAHIFPSHPDSYQPLQIDKSVNRKRKKQCRERARERGREILCR